MKKNILLFILACIPSLMVWSQIETKEEKEIHDLIGVWQLCQLMQNPEDANNFKIVRIPFFKILQKEGNFMNLFLSQEKSNITGYGTFEIISENSYTETIDKSYTNPSDNNRINKLTYELDNKNQFLFIKYFLIDSYSGKMGESRELWVRVEAGNPFIKNDAPTEQPLEESKNN